MLASARNPCGVLAAGRLQNLPRESPFVVSKYPLSGDVPRNISARAFKHGCPESTSIDTGPHGERP